MKIRVLSAIIMLIAVIPIVILGDIYFKLLVCLLGIFSMNELFNIRERKIPLFLRICSYIILFLFVYLSNDYTASYTLNYKMIICLIGVFLFPIVFINDNNKYNVEDAFLTIGAILFLSVAFNSFIIIRNFDLLHFVYLTLITIMTDTFALFTGNLIGTHKLCEKISPKKTIEGSIGGSLVGTIVSFLFYKFLINSAFNTWTLIFITFCLTVIGQIGDLIFSAIKRKYNVKDFSNLIPGHGGILDRLDSMILVMMTYILLLNLF